MGAWELKLRQLTVARRGVDFLPLKKGPCYVENL